MLEDCYDGSQSLTLEAEEQQPSIATDAGPSDSNHELSSNSNTQEQLPLRTNLICLVH